MDKPYKNIKKSEYYQLASNSAPVAEDALENLAVELDLEKLSFVLLFFPQNIDPDEVQPLVKKHFDQTIVFGATSAGQITGLGYERDAFVALGFPKSHFRIASLLIEPVAPLEIEEVSRQIEQTVSNFSHTAGWNRLGLLLTDGLSKQEDVLIAIFSATIPNIPVFGGSAAECRNSNKTMILADGEFHDNAAVFLLVETDLGYDLVNFDHFEATNDKLVVTDALPDERIVTEINGAPAVEEYARIIGVEPSELQPEDFAKHPFLVKVGPEYHARAIQKINQDGTISLLCSIDKGVILHIGKADEIVRRLRKELEASALDGRRPEFILAFDCFLRRLEIEQRGRVEDASELLREYRVFGFNTFGEQHSGLHVNQTFVGISFFEPQKRLQL